MPATRSHVLIATDKALKAFLEAADIADLDDDHIGRNKEIVDKEFPVLICGSESAERGRAKNWKVSGSLLLKTDITDEAGVVTDAQKEASDAMELAVLDALEDKIPGDDRPQPLADAITAAAIAAGVVASNEWMMTAFTPVRVSAGFDEDEVWTFSVDFTATVIA